MAVSTTSDLNGLYNTIYEEALFYAREMNMMARLVTPYSARGWMTRNISTRPQLTAESVAEGVDYAGAASFGKSTVATLTPGEIITQVILTDREIETDPDETVRDAVTEMGGAIATKIDVDLTSDFASLTTDVGPGANSAATIAKFAVGVSVLRNNKIPTPYYAVVHPYAWHDIWVLLGQPAATYVLLGDVANQALRDFYVGNWINLQWFTNANIATDANSDAVSAIFNSQALALDTRKAPMMEPDRDPSLRATELNMTAGYAHGVRRPTYGVKYTCDVTTPT